MELKEFKEYLLNLKLERLLNYDESQSYILNEAFESLDDPEFKIKENEYIKSNPVIKDYQKLTPSEKLQAINIIDKVISKGETNLIYKENQIPAIEVAANAPAAFFRNVDENTQKRIRDFYFAYYNPMNSAAGQKAMSLTKANIKKDNINYDIFIETFYEIVNYLLKKGFDPERGTFDFILFTGWALRAQKKIERSKKGILSPDDEEFEYGDVYGGSRIKTANQRKEFADRDEYDDYVAQGGAEEEVPTDATTEQPEIMRMKEEKMNDLKIEYLKNKLSSFYAKLLDLLYEYYKMRNNESNAEIDKKIIDTVTSPDIAALDKFAPEGDSIEDQKFYTFFANRLGISYEAAKSRMSRLKEKTIKLIKNPEFIKVMGLENFPLKKITRQGLFRGMYKEGKEKSKKISELQLERILIYSKISLNENLSQHKSKLNQIHNSKIKISQLSEGYEVDTISLDEQIYKYLNIVTEDLTESLDLLNELYRIHEEIKLEYPEISEQLQDLIPPVETKIKDLVQEVKKVKQSIRPYLSGIYESDLKKKSLSEDELEEERLTNPETKKYVRKRQNFIGSHIYGEDLGGLGKMYVAYSYGEQFPAYLWFKNKWYHNTDNYVLDDGSVNEPTNQHKADMRPVQDTHGLSTYALNTMIRKFKSKYGIGDNVHKDVEPGEKN